MFYLHLILLAGQIYLLWRQRVMVEVVNDKYATVNSLVQKLRVVED